MKNEKEMLDYIERFITQQGNEGAMKISPLLIAMVERLFAEPVTGVSPIVVNIDKQGKVEGTRTTYEVSTPQTQISSYIDYANEERERSRVFIHDGSALLGFPYLEFDENSISGRVEVNDGECGLYLSKISGNSYFYHEDTTAAIPEVTNAAIQTYKDVFGAIYDRVNNKFMILFGATEFRLSPSEMMIVHAEFNKVSTSGDYTAMWANTIAKMVHVAPWYDGFSEFNLHAAFANAKNLIIVDLATEDLKVNDINLAFSGCERLEQVAGVMSVDEGTSLSLAFKGCKVLNTFKIKGLNSNIDLSDCPMLSRETVEYLVKNSGAKPFTIMLHSEVRNNVNNDNLWADVKELIKSKSNITIA